MKIFDLGVAQYVIRNCGLKAPEQIQLHAYTRKSALLDLWNSITGRSTPYLIWGHEVHLAGPGRMLLGRDSLITNDLRALLQETERSKWKALRMSLRRTVN